MRLGRRSLSPVVAVAAGALGIIVAPSAAADCNVSGGSTLCASGTVRGGSAPPSGSFSPYPCSGDPTCDYYDNWDPQVYLDFPNFGFGGNGNGNNSGARPGAGNRPSPR